MTGTEVALIITASATLVTSLGGFVVLLRKVEIIHKATNSMTDKLVAVTAKESHAAGVKEEKDREKDDSTLR